MAFLAATLVTGCGSPESKEPPATSSATTGDPECSATDLSACAAPKDAECGHVSCNAGRCERADEPAGTPLAGQVDGDCKLLVCDGEGAASSQDDEDPESDGDDCTEDTCASGTTLHAALPDGAPCAGGLCKDGACVAPGCTNGLPDGGESDVDCGGPCPPCRLGQECAADEDCQSASCDAGLCAPPTCVDGAKNGSESDVDCGGPDCSLCGVGQMCMSASDCVTSSCVNLFCAAPGCDDGMENGLETDVDCGGPDCLSCLLGEACSVGSDCESTVCIANKCVTPTCSDGVKDAAETGVDCGGPSCPACAPGSGCSVPGDCTSGVCASEVCASPTCQDGVENGLESDVDCGGPACDGCGVGQSCASPADCTSLSCAAGLCAAPTCSDGVKNGAEKGVDCGGTCSLCAAGETCADDADCLTGACNTGVCGHPRFLLDSALGFSQIAQGYSSTSADFDGDGTRDVAIGTAGGVAVYLNDGNGRFAPPVLYGAGLSPSSVAAGDLDGDGDADLAVGYFTNNGVAVLFNDGSGVFGAAVTHATTTPVYDVALLDADGDTDLDVAAAAATKLLVMLNQGNGALQLGPSHPGEALDVAVGDLDADGDPDLVFAPSSVGAPMIRVMDNLGGGSFAPPVDYSTAIDTQGIAIGDIDRDGDEDVIATAGYGIYTFLGTGTGTFIAGPSTQLLMSYPMEPALHDIDADGYLDIVLPNWGVNPELVANVAIVHNTKDATFQLSSHYPVARNSRAPLVADFDGDCLPDVAVAAGYGLDVLYNSGSGAFFGAAWFKGGPELAVGDFNGDGLDDVVGVTDVYPIDGSFLAIHLNQGGSFGSTQVFLPSWFSYHQIAPADYNQDGALDIVAVEYNTSKLLRLANQGDGTFVPGPPSNTCLKPTFVTSGHLNFDTKIDVVVGCEGVAGTEREVDILVGAPNSTFTVAQKLPNEPEDLVLIDLDGDGDKDIAYTAVDNGGPYVTTYLNNGAAQFSFKQKVYVDGVDAARDLAAADVDADGDQDLAMAVEIPSAPAAIIVLRNNGAAVLQQPEVYPVPWQMTSDLQAGDLDGDGRVDLAAVSRNQGLLGVLLNVGGGLFKEPLGFPAGYEPGSIGLFHFDGDGLLDVAVGNSYLYVLRNLSGAGPAACPVCGDGTPAYPEVCDDGSTGGGDGCSPTCGLDIGYSCSGAPSLCQAVCGDELLAGAEGCDDGGLSAGDGCSAVCQAEPGWLCSGAQSACEAVCGDGLTVGTEECDDGNTTGSDGCPATCHSVLWAKVSGTSGNHYGREIARDGAGNFVVAGEFSGSFNLWGGPLQSAGSNDVFVTKLNGAGQHLWTLQAGDSADQRALAIATDGSGNIVVTGVFSGTIDFGGGPLTSAGSWDLFVAKLDPAGNHLWSKRFGDSQQQEGRAIAVDAQGNVVLAGAFMGGIDLGGGLLTSAGMLDVFVAKLDAAGNHLWSKRAGDAAKNQAADAIAVLPGGGVALTGSFSGVLDVGLGVMNGANEQDVFLIAFDAGGNAVWQRRAGYGGSYDFATGVAADAAGTVFWTGFFEGASIDLGTGPLFGAGQQDLFIAAYDPSGAPIWALRAGGLQSERANSIAVRPSGGVVVTGVFHGPTDLGGGPIPFSGFNNPFLLGVGPSGEHVFSRGLTADTGTGTSVVADGPDRVALTGWFAGEIDFGAGPLAGGSGYDVFIAQLEP